MKKLLFASAAALSMAAVPAIAQVEAKAPLGSTNSVADKRGDFTPEQQAIYDSMNVEYRTVFDTYSSDQQVLYFGWEAALRDYYWTLSEDQREAWWSLSDVQRISLFQRELAWSDVMDGYEPDYSGETVAYATTAQPTKIKYQSNGMVQSVPSPRTGDYPICESDADDSCMNAWAAGMRGPGVDRPLGYFPEDEARRGG